MATKLPSRPNLDHLRRQAKTLLASLASGDADAARLFHEHLPAAKGLTPTKVKDAGFRLADAQSVVARSTGFAAWPNLAHHVEQLRALEGTWTFVSLEVDGSSVPAAAMVSSRLLIDGDRFRTESPEAVYEGVFNIDVAADPHAIDIEFVEGPEAGNWNHGIFRLQGDTLHLCLDMNGKQRRKAFKTPAKSGHAYEVLKRESLNRPEGVDGGDRAGRAIAAPSKPAVDVGAFASAPSDTLTRLQGEWSAEAITRDGQTLPGFMLKTASRSASGNKLRITVGGMTVIHALVRIDESHSPTRVDYLYTAGPAIGSVQQGIMEWRGEVAWFCMGGPGQPRPTKFESTPGSGMTLSAWKPRALNPKQSRAR